MLCLSVCHVRDFVKGEGARQRFCEGKRSFVIGAAVINTQEKALARDFSKQFVTSEIL